MLNDANMLLLIMAHKHFVSRILKYQLTSVVNMSDVCDTGNGRPAANEHLLAAGDWQDAAGDRHCSQHACRLETRHRWYNHHVRESSGRARLHVRRQNTIGMAQGTVRSVAVVHGVETTILCGVEALMIEVNSMMLPPCKITCQWIRSGGHGLPVNCLIVSCMF